MVAPTDERDNDEAGVRPTTASLLLAAGRDHIRQIAELPGLIGDAARGFSRVRRRTRERGDHPDLADAFDAPPTFLNHVVSPQRRFATAALRLADVKATAKALGYHVQRPDPRDGGRRHCGSCCCATTGSRPPDHRVGADRDRQVGPRHRQRDQRPVDFAAGARRRPRSSGPSWSRWPPRSPRKTTRSSARDCTGS